MGTMKKVIMTSALTMFAGAAFAATAPAGVVTAKMQAAADKEGSIIRQQVNTSDAGLACNEAAIRIGKQARSAAPASYKGNVLQSSVANAITSTAVKYRLANDCINPVMASRGATAATGVNGPKSAFMGLGKVAGAGGLLGGAGSVAGISSTVLLGGLAAVAGIAVIASDDDDDDDKNASPST